MTKHFADFKEDLRLFCSENKVDNDKISIVGVSKKKAKEDQKNEVKDEKNQ